METPGTALADEYENAPALAGAHIALLVPGALCYNRRTVGGAVFVWNDINHRVGHRNHLFRLTRRPYSGPYATISLSWRQASFQANGVLA